ncbi:hypothetical protein B484DRAFT_445359 [Ochromonadaceae sp. CCMP2298]|nr:hypothetical protein B484DRAFT_445359 [Ochromonadaceae sp. CCMP2298]
MLYEVTPKPIAPHLNQIVPALFEALKTQRAKSARCAVLRCLIDLVACVDHLHLVEVHRRMWEVEYAGEEREINELAHQLFLDVQQRLYGALHGEVNADFHSAAQSVIRQVIHSDGELLQDLGCNPEVLIFSQLLQLTSRLTSKRRGDKDGDGRGPLLKDHLLPAMLHFVRHTADLGAVRVAHRRLGFDEDQCLQDVWVLSRLQNEIGKKARLVLEAVREREEKEKE